MYTLTYIQLHTYVQWNLRIKDKLVLRPMSTIRRLSFIGEFVPKIIYFTFHDILDRILYYTLPQCEYMSDLQIK